MFGKFCKVLIKLEVVPKQRLSSYSDDYCCVFDPETNNSKDLQRSHLSTKVGKYFQLYYSWLKLLLVGLSRWLGAHHAYIRCTPQPHVHIHTTLVCTTHTSAIYHPYLPPSSFQEMTMRRYTAMLSLELSISFLFHRNYRKGKEAVDRIDDPVISFVDPFTIREDRNTPSLNSALMCPNGL